MTRGFKRSYNTFTEREKKEVFLNALKRSPKGLTGEELAYEAGCERHYVSKMIKRLGNKVWIKKIGGNNLCIYYWRNYARKLNLLKERKEEMDRWEKGISKTIEKTPSMEAISV